MPPPVAAKGETVVLFLLLAWLVGFILIGVLSFFAALPSLEMFCMVAAEMYTGRWGRLVDVAAANVRLASSREQH